MERDSRLNPGAYVHALACRVLRPNDAKQRLGTGYKTKHIEGRVISVSTKCKNKRRYRYLHCLFAIGDSTKQCTLPLSSVKAGPGFVPEREPQHGREDPHHVLNEAYKKLTEDAAPMEVNSQEHRSEPAGNSARARPTPVGRSTADSPADTPEARASVRQYLQNVSPVTPPTFSENSTVSANGQEWSDEVAPEWINGIVKPISCRVKGPDNSVLNEGTAGSTMSLLDFFLWMFPIPHLSVIVELTNKNLRQAKHRETSAGEILKLFGALVLMTRCKFSDRRELWGEEQASPITGTPKFGNIMSRNRFENLRANIRFSRQQDASGEYTEQNQWELCEDFVEAFNQHRREHLSPYHYLCVDESISRWYGLGGSWIDVGSPHFVKLDRKPEHGLELQDIACGKSGILLGLKLVKSAEETLRNTETTNHNHGTNVLVELCAPWADKERIICADSFFASVDAAETLLEKNLRFTGVIKTATSRFPIAHFGRQEMFHKGNYNSLRTKLNVGGEDKQAVALCWLDRNRRHFISTAGRVGVDVAQQRVRWRQHEDGACPVEVTITIPELVKEYYAVAGIIDSHNRIRQDSLDLEKTIEVKEWSFRINCTILGMILTDTWLLYKFGSAGREIMKPHIFWSKLGMELVYNGFDGVGIIRRPLSTVRPLQEWTTASGSGLYLTPTKKRRLDDNTCAAKLQKLCKACPRGSRMKSSWICAHCRYQKGLEVFICHNQTGRHCFNKHVRDYH